jgi:DNA polymerase III alpha subunit (gram-positive type)
MSVFLLDIEADGPIPGDYSMVSFGAVLVRKGLAVEDMPFFFGELHPISDNYVPEALAVSGYSREQTMQFPLAESVMQKFDSWLKINSKDRPMLISDNNGFDAMFISWYFHHFLKKNPFGHSSTNLGSLYKGMVKNTRKNFKHLRKTRHSHNPVDDSRGNVEALLHMVDKMGLVMELT